MKKIEQKFNKKRYLELKKLLKDSYSPYSNFATAAIVSTDKGEFPGVNIENSSFGATICAERVAVFNAVLNRAKKFYKLDLISNSVDKKVFPCGQCLQVMSEFFDIETPINVYTFDGKFIPYTLKEFLPYIFKKRIIDDVNSKKAK